MHEFSELPALHAPQDAQTVQTLPQASAWQWRCPVCAEVERIDSTYVERSFGPRSPAPAIAESIADDLGFCERHGRGLAANPDPAQPARIAHAFAMAIALIEPLLHESVVDERCQHLFFSAGRRCPACSADDAAAGRLLGPIRQGWLRAPEDEGIPEALCWRHFQSLASRLALEPRGQAIQRYLRTLDTVAQGLARNPGLSMAHALALLGQGAQQEATGGIADPAGDASACMQDLLAAPDACPICEAIGGARRRWLHRLHWAGVHGATEFLWLFAPCCARHVADAARLGHVGLLEGVAAFALSGIGEQMRQQLAGIVHEMALAQQPRPVWYRPRRRGKPAAPAAAGPARRRFVLRCQGCEAEAIALERACGEFLECLRKPRGRDLLAQEHGLCLRHLAHLLPVAAPQTVRMFLTELHLARLCSLRVALASEQGASAPWREAVYRFRGWPACPGCADLRGPH